ncbi:MAG: DUF4249 domain-containing protein [Chitinophagaceae bacterium]
MLYFSCSKPLELPNTDSDKSILIFEGDILTGDQPVTNFLILSRLNNFDSKFQAFEENAKVTIMDDRGGSWNLEPTLDGKYKNTSIYPSDRSYKFHVETKEGVVYESALEKPLYTPPIDSLTYSQGLDDVTIFVHSHDSNNDSKYFRWSFEETWERHSFYESFYDYVNGQLVERGLENQIYRCWKTVQGAGVVIANTTGLSESRISYLPITKIYEPDDRISVRYSINVRQIALSKEAYEFWNILKKNTETTGSLFDPQPSALPTNISCISDSKKIVIGFVSVTTQAEKRFFIKNSEMNGWTYPLNDKDCLLQQRSPGGALYFLSNTYPDFIPISYSNLGNAYSFAKNYCVDCRVTGGVNVKPDFW